MERQDDVPAVRIADLRLPEHAPQDRRKTVDLIRDGIAVGVHQVARRVLRRELVPLRDEDLPARVLQDLARDLPLHLIGVAPVDQMA